MLLEADFRRQYPTKRSMIYGTSTEPTEEGTMYDEPMTLIVFAVVVGLVFIAIRWFMG
jgi:hypothetical protein